MAARHTAEAHQRRAGRYAPSPSGDLHLGNLRTAVLAWLWARHTERDFRLRVDDIDAQRSSPEAAQRQLDDLSALGITHDGPVVTQQESLDLYRDALEDLQGRGLVYPCFCSRKDIAEATRAPHATPGIYPGTCRNLTERERQERSADFAARGRVPSLRLASGVQHWSVTELCAQAVASPSETGADGNYFRGDVDDMILRRGGNVLPGCGAGEPGDDGAGGHSNDFAYNLAVVVDDAAAGVDQVVRGDDLLSSAPRQAYLAHLLGLPTCEYVHVPLVLNREGKRLAKRDGAVTLREVGALGAMKFIDATLRLNPATEETDPLVILRELQEWFEPGKVPREPVTWPL